MQRDSAVVWLGTARRIHDCHELEEVTDRSHPLIKIALSCGLGYYCDRFDNEDPDEADYFLLVGRNLAALGLKEGALAFEAQPAELAAELEQIGNKLSAAGITDKPALHVLFHVDNY